MKLLKKLAVALLSVFAAPAWPAIAVVGGQLGAASGGGCNAPYPVAFTPTNAGDLLVTVGVLFSDAATPASTMVSTGSQGTWALLSPPGAAGGGAALPSGYVYQGLGYNLSSAAVSQTAQMACSGGAPTNPWMVNFTYEFSGVASVGSGASNVVNSPGTGTGAIQGTPVTVCSGCWLFVVVSSYESGGTVTPVGATWNDTSAGAGGADSTWLGTGGTITPSFTDSTAAAGYYYTITQVVLTPSGGSSITHACATAGGAVTVPTAGTTSCALKGGTFGTVDGVSVQYRQPALSNFGVN